MLEKVKNFFSNVLVKSFFRNSLYRYFQSRSFWHNKYVVILFLGTAFLQIITWVLWIKKISPYGFTVETGLNFLFNIPLIPRFFSLLFLSLFVALVNFILSYVIYRKEQFFSFLLMFSAFVLGASVLAVTIFYIYSLQL